MFPVLRIFLCFLFALSSVPTVAHTAPPKKIGIFTLKHQGVEPWDPDSIKTGIAGSEEAVIYVSNELAKLGYDVTVIGDPPENSPYSQPDANPRYIDIEQDDGTFYDIGVYWRFMALRKRAQKSFFWPHDTCSHSWPIEFIEAIDDVLWLSEWQRENWSEADSRFSQFTNIMGNGILPEQFRPIGKRENPHSCIYASNYGRGLEILLDIWPIIRKNFPKATLDIYYGWVPWSLLTEEQEIKMRQQISDLAPLGVKEHGRVGHEELNRAFEKASIWAYPCIDLETFCITALRAQLSGCFPVIIEGSALRETVPYGFRVQNSTQYCGMLMKAMLYLEKHPDFDRSHLGDFILEHHTWEKVAQRWDALFKQDSEGSRKGS